MDIKNLKSREKMLIGGLAIVIATGVYIKMVYQPLEANITKHKTQIRKLETRLESLKEKFPSEDVRMKIKDLGERNADLHQRILEMERSLPTESTTSLLLGAFTTLAEDVKLLALKQSIEQEGNYSQLLIEVEFDASFQSLVDYITRLEGISDYLSVREVQIATPERNAASQGAISRLMMTSILGGGSTSENINMNVEIESEAVARNIFLSKEAPAELVGGAAVELNLEGITHHPVTPTAIINGEVVRENAEIENYKVKYILPDIVILTDIIDEKSELRLELKR